jgi:hypothetical protein
MSLLVKCDVKELMQMQEHTYFSDQDLRELGYSKEGLIWVIAEDRYRLVEATKDGYYFIKVG